MPSADDPKFPRKLLTGTSAEAVRLQAALNAWSVHPVCARLWAGNRELRRNDTFIGLIDTETWTVYLAPCFGLTPEEAKAKGVAPAGVQIVSRQQVHRDMCEALSQFQKVPPAPPGPADLRLPDDLRLVAGSTSREADVARTTTWAEVRDSYRDGELTHRYGVCIAPFFEVPAGRGFDGVSHQAFECWIRNNITPPVSPTFKKNALGFAIQRDALSYFVRFASSFNQAEWGASGSDVNVVFGAHAAPAKDAGREIRDMPKEWAKHLVTVLARDLHLGYMAREKPGTFGADDRTNHRPEKPDKFFGRIRSRGEDDSTKIKRIFTAGDTLENRPTREDRRRYGYLSHNDGEFRLS